MGIDLLGSMRKYIHEAFWVKVDFPLVGPLPVNVLALSALAAAGGVFPPIWLIGLGVEVAFIFLLATSQRFQRYVDAMDMQYVRQKERQSRPPQRERILAELSAQAKKRIARLTEIQMKILDLYRKFQVDDFTFRQNSEALQKLLLSYARLLFAHESIQTHWSGNAEEIQKEVSEIEKELDAGDQTAELKTSKVRTLEILRMRLENQKRKENILEEIDSELRRIESQFDLALENAAISSKPYTVSSDVLFDVTKLDSALPQALFEEAELPEDPAPYTPPQRGRMRMRE